MQFLGNFNAQNLANTAWALAVATVGQLHIAKHYEKKQRSAMCSTSTASSNRSVIEWKCAVRSQV